MQILFIEDDPMNRRVVKDMLSVAGVEMMEADNAELGLSMIDREMFDLILMDLRMPGMDGLTAIQMLRQRHDIKARIPVIVVTADTAADLRARCMEVGADDLITKPVAMDALFEAIGVLIAARPAHPARLC